MSADLEPIPATALPLALSKLGVIVPYSACWRRAIDGQIPSHRRGRLVMFRPEDLPDIAAFFRAEALGGPRKPGPKPRTAANPVAISAN